MNGLKSLCAVGGMVWALGSPAFAQEVKLPATLTFSAYDTGTAGFNTAVAVGKMLKEKAGVNLRVLPVGNDVGRLSLIKDGRAQVTSMGIGSYFAQEGLFEFATREWGPQPLRLLLASYGCDGPALAVAKDVDVRDVKDVVKVRVASVVGSPGINQNTLAILAFAGLNAKNVKFVQFSGHGAAWKGLLNNDVDVVFGTTSAPQSREADTSPRGLFWLPTPAADKEGWSRMTAIAPYFLPRKVTCGVGLLPGGTELPIYPYPIFLSDASQPADIVYGIAKMMVVNYDAYKESGEPAAGLELSRQNLKWVIPYHEGTVRVLRERNMWTPELEEHNAKLVARQEVLAAAWKSFLQTSPSEDREAFAKAWQAARGQALNRAGMSGGAE